MRFVERKCRYFARYGARNTEDVIEIVSRRLKEGDLRTVIVASTSGSTGLKFAEALKNKAKVIAVSYQEMSPRLRNKILDLGGAVIEEADLPLHKRGMDKVRNAFYTLGQGFKVAVEVMLIAVDEKAVNPGEEVIGVGGTEKGADTAIVLKATSSRKIFSSDPDERLEIREILAMPLKKMWWE